MRGFVAGLVIGLLLAAVVSFAQVTVVENSTVSMRAIPGLDSQWYVYCVENCERLLEVADVTEVYAGFDTWEAARNHRFILLARLTGTTPNLIDPAYTPTPGG